MKTGPGQPVLGGEGQLRTQVHALRLRRSPSRTPGRCGRGGHRLDPSPPMQHIKCSFQSFYRYQVAVTVAMTSRNCSAGDRGWAGTWRGHQVGCCQGAGGAAPFVGHTPCWRPDVPPLGVVSPPAPSLCPPCSGGSVISEPLSWAGAGAGGSWAGGGCKDSSPPWPETLWRPLGPVP